MNIGIDMRAAKWYRGTGIGTYTYQLINAMNNIDSINKYTLFNDDDTLNINFNQNFEISYLKSNSSNIFWNNVNHPTVLKDKDLNIYHVPQNGIGLPICHSHPFVITLHDTIPLHMPETVGETYLNIFNTQMESIINRCDGIITVSEFSKEDISKDFNFPKDKIHVTHLASEDIYKPINKTLCRNILKQHYSIPANYILYVGGFSPRKNISGLIEAFSKIHTKLPSDMKLIIAGSKGLSYPIYKSLSERLGMTDKIIFPGFISMEHMPYLYNSASLLVYPSFYEGFGLPPLEAMACGTPVVASNVTSLPEVLGDSALLCSPYSTNELMESILSALLDNTIRESLIKKGFDKCNSLTWEKTAAETLKIYDSIIINNY
ncbi:MAG: glycosyltransferase family 1 protein [Clostridium sp.]|uniref:glycosyltransferase family 4 protein n=1 Tax=Clostridium sp. TaxID=1506 RepID=UPI00305B9010